VDRAVAALKKALLDLLTRSPPPARSLTTTPAPRLAALAPHLPETERETSLRDALASHPRPNGRIGERHKVPLVSTNVNNSARDCGVSEVVAFLPRTGVGGQRQGSPLSALSARRSMVGAGAPEVSIATPLGSPAILAAPTERTEVAVRFGAKRVIS
jgi:hypothetical protein